MSDKISLLCWVLGEGPYDVFEIQVGLTDSVIHLKKAIYNERVGDMAKVNPNSLRPRMVGEIVLVHRWAILTP